MVDAKRKIELYKIAYKKCVQAFNPIDWLKGSELEEWTGEKTVCKTCNGAGEVQADRRGIDGNECPDCGGE